jgi:hypothetical protein
MLDRVRLDLRFDAQALVEDLDRLVSCEWIDHFVQQNYEGSWQVLPLRGKAGETHPVMQIYSDPTCKHFEDTALLDSTPYFREVLETFQCPLRAVRLMKLTPGSRIKEHTDYDLAAENGEARLHIPITTNEKVTFLLNGTRVRMDAGECWYLRLSDPHSASNAGDTDRIHLVIDTEVDPWLRAHLQSAVGV